MKVRVLSDNVINKIAAGEVVERPESIVRELVDNAVDAGATEISVYLEGGGCSSIRVVDNGEGMSRDDALLALERHATSKLNDAEDLLRIKTLGFRGEALSSIAAISKLTLRTRTPDEQTATEVHVRGGVFEDVRDAAGPAGTDITVRNIFFNTPARKKFLKSAATEGQRVKRWLQQALIVRPEVRIRVFLDDREVLNLPVHADACARGQSIFRASKLTVNYKSGGIRVQGVLGHPGLAQTDAAALCLFVNRRLVRDKVMLRAVREGFQSMLKEREFPLGFVSIDMPPEAVDVNVHPQKSEVRFRHSQDIYLAIREAVGAAVRDYRGAHEIRAVSATGPAAPRVESRYVPAAVEGRQLQALFAVRESGVPYKSEVSPEARRIAQPRLSELRYLGQAFKCYLFCEHEERLYVVDMHAAHERYNFNLVRNSFAAAAPSTQYLLTPLVVHLTETGLENCLRNEAMLSRLGFEIEQFGPSELLVRSVPAMLADRDCTELLKELAASELAEEVADSVQTRIDHAAARIACHASIRAGYIMEREEVYALFAALDSAAFSTACPHGRPIVAAFDRCEVERWFGRDR